MWYVITAIVFFGLGAWVQEKTRLWPVPFWMDSIDDDTVYIPPGSGYQPNKRDGCSQPKPPPKQP